MAEIGTAPAARGEHLRAHVAAIRTKTKLRAQQLRAEALSRASGEGVVLDELGDADACPFDSEWSPLGLDVLERTPPLRRWLLRRPAEDGGPGEGMLPLGKCGLLVADGGVGKSAAIIALGVSIVVGRPWFGHFPIGTEAVGRRVLLALGEEDREDRDRRVYDTCCALRLNDIERALVARQLVVLPLAGKPVALVAPGHDRRVGETPALERLRRKLRDDAGEGWALVVLDPLARFAEGEVESSNAEATRFVQAVETLTEVPGRPTVLLAHHASADGVKMGDPSSRGVTGIRNGFRWEAVLRVDDGDVLFRQKKSNYSAPMLADVRLVRGAGGVLRVASADLMKERAAAAEERSTERNNAALDDGVRRIMAALDAKGGVALAVDQLVTWAGMGKTPGRLAVAEALTRGVLVKEGSSRAAKFTRGVCVTSPHTPLGAEASTPSGFGPSSVDPMDASEESRRREASRGVHPSEALGAA
jgi:hypothetical protein